jgi:hypothetical protein
VLQGDEIRACWQAPSRPEPYEGLFRKLDSGAPRDDSARSARVDLTPDRDLVGTRTWAVPILPDRAPATTVGSTGLREAPFVPARDVRRSPGAGTGGVRSDDLEGRGVTEDLAVAEDDPHGDQTIIRGRALDDAHP